MLLSEVFENLHDAELSQLNLGFEGIEEKHYPKIIRYINLGLLELYKKFDLLTKEVIITLDSSITDYLLTYDYAESNPLATTKYIQDTIADPFDDDVLQIMTVWDEAGEKVPLNDAAEEDSVFTPHHKTLQVPDPVDGNSLSLIYRAAPEKILTSVRDLTTVEIDLPDQLMTALTAYIGYRAHLGFPEGDASKSTAMFARFRGTCQTVIELGTLNRPETSSQKFEDNGFC